MAALRGCAGWCGARAAAACAERGWLVGARSRGDNNRPPIRHCRGLSWHCPSEGPINSLPILLSSCSLLIPSEPSGKRKEKGKGKRWRGFYIHFKKLYNSVVMLLGMGIILLAALYYLYFRHTRSRLYELAARLPDVAPLPLLGNVHQFLGGPERILQSIKYVCDGIIKQGGVGKAWLGPKLYIVITNPEDAQIVLENCLQKDIVYKFLQAWLGNGLFVAPVELWKVHRRVLIPVFQNRIIEEYIQVFGEQGAVLVERLAGRCGAGSFDVFHYITSCTLDIVFETAMGERMDVQRSPETPYLKARNTVMSIINMRFFKVWLQPDFLFNLTSYAKLQKENIDITHAFADEVVKRKRIEYESHQQKDTGSRKVLLELLFGRDIKFTDEQLREHIDSITIAGNDTTALVISYALVLLGAHQHAQRKLADELEEIFGESQRAPTKEDLLRMHYLERVIKETMRLYTVVPIIARTADKEIQLSRCRVPAGAGCVIGSFAMHRSRALWGADADRFEPDRFLPERSVGRHPAAFIPFSFGARNCIGRHFGMLVMKSLIANVIRSYRVTATDCTRLKIEILLFPVHGHRLELQKRERGAARSPLPLRPATA